MTNKPVARAALILLFFAGCPTRTIYYDAGAGDAGPSQGGTSGRESGGGASTGLTGAAGVGGGTAGLGGGAAGSGSAGSGGGAAGSQGGQAGAGGVTDTAGNAGTRGGAGSNGTAGAAGGAASSCLDTTSDSKNCGRCGHDCLGGTCSASQCQPLLLGQFTGNPNNLSVAAQFVYVTTDSGYIARVNKDGTDVRPFAMPSFSSTAFQGTPVGEDGDRAFFVWNGSPIRLVYCGVSSCDSSITPLGGPYSQYFAVDPADHKIAWIDYSPSQFWTASTVGVPTATAVPGGTLASGSSGSRVVYAKGGLYYSIGQSIERLPLSGGAQTTVGYTSTQTSTSLVVLAANSDSLFFSDGSTIFSTPLPSGNGAPGTKLIDTDVSGHTGVLFVADDASVYWSTSGVQSCQLTNCSGTQKVVSGTNADQYGEIGADATAIYWTQGATVPGQKIAAFTLWKLAK